MPSKGLVSAGILIGSILGGYLPVLFGVDPFSYLSILGSGIGGILGLFLAVKISNF